MNKHDAVNHPGEIWKPSRWPGYEISDLGRFRGKRGILRSCKGSGGYRQITIRVDGRPTSIHLHTEVAHAFLGPRPEGLQCAHQNGDRMDARLSNLAYKTVRENHADKHRHGTQPVGETVCSAKLTNIEAEQVVAAVTRGETQSSVARRFGISQASVSRIVNGSSYDVTGAMAIRLTWLMKEQGILRIAHTGGGFSVYMRGDILGTGKTVGEAYQCALNAKAAQAVRQVAA